MDHSPATTVHGGPDVELVPEARRVERVLADQHLAQRHSHVVRGGRLQAGTRNPGIQIRFTDPGDALIGAAIAVAGSSIGAAIIIGAIARGIYGIDERHFVEGGIDSPPIHLGPVTFTAVEALIFATAIVLMLATL